MLLWDQWGWWKQWYYHIKVAAEKIDWLIRQIVWYTLMWKFTFCNSTLMCYHLFFIIIVVPIATAFRTITTEWKVGIKHTCAINLCLCFLMDNFYLLHCILTRIICWYTWVIGTINSFKVAQLLLPRQFSFLRVKMCTVRLVVYLFLIK